MYRSPGRGLPKKRRLTPEELAAANQKRADGLLAQIRHWLDALEKFHNLRNASRRPFTTTRCSGGGGNHWTHVRRLPQPPRRTTHLACTAPRDKYPDAVLMERVIAPLRSAGFEVSETTNHNCGCATFIVKPRKLAGQ